MSSTYLVLYYHIIFSTKNRAGLIDTSWRSRLHDYLGGSINRLGKRSHGVGGMDDHIHLLVELNATHRLSDFVRDIKKAASAWAHDTVGLKDFAWQEGYATLTVSPSDVDQVHTYIQNQEEHHRHRTYREEVLTLLRRAGLEVDERYFD